MSTLARHTTTPFELAATPAALLCCWLEVEIPHRSLVGDKCKYQAGVPHRARLSQIASYIQVKWYTEFQVCRYHTEILNIVAPGIKKLKSDTKYVSGEVF